MMLAECEKVDKEASAKAGFEQLCTKGCGGFSKLGVLDGIRYSLSHFVPKLPFKVRGMASSLRRNDKSISNAPNQAL